MNRKKIALCTICTDKYIEKHIKLKNSVDKFFLKNHDVNFFVYTDQLNENNLTFKIAHLPSPLITFMKFHFLFQKKIVLENHDLIYFLDCDCEIIDFITEEIFPTKELPIVVTKHPWQGYNSDSYENNIKSTAYVEKSMNNHYFQACFFGGYSEYVFKMCQSISEMINTDLSNRYIAKWFDESYLNKYLLDQPKKILDCGYAYPNISRWGNNFNAIPKIIHDNSFSA